jgi:hypothetical protein
MHSISKEIASPGMQKLLLAAVALRGSAEPSCGGSRLCHNKLKGRQSDKKAIIWRKEGRSEVGRGVREERGKEGTPPQGINMKDAGGRGV